MILQSQDAPHYSCSNCYTKHTSIHTRPPTVPRQFLPLMLWRLYNNTKEPLQTTLTSFLPSLANHELWGGFSGPKALQPPRPTAYAGLH